MKTRARFVSALLVAALLTQGWPSTARAQEYQENYDELNQICWADGSPTTDPQTAVAQSLFHHEQEGVPQMMDLYLQARRAHDEMAWTLLISRIKNKIFSEPFSDEYESSLRYIDSRHWEDPESIHELAKSLQIHWELRYANGLAQRQNLHFNNGVKGGFVVGVIAAVILSIAMMKRGGAGVTPRYFKVFRSILPLIGAGVGGAGAYIADRTGLLDVQAPRSPAHIMRLGEADETIDLGNQQLVDSMISITAGIAATTAAIRIIRVIGWLNRAATPLKVHPVVLVASLIIGYLVEEGVAKWLEHREYLKMVRPVLAARDRIVRGQRTGSDSEIFDGAEALVRTSLDLAAYDNRPILEAIQNYESEMGALEQRDPDHGCGYRYSSAQYAQELSAAVENATEDAAYPYHSDHEGYMVRGFLRAHDPDSVESLGPLAKRRADGYMAYFDRWIADEEEREQVNFALPTRNWFFGRFIDAIDHAKDVEIANEFVEDDEDSVRKDSNRVLLQAAALMRTTGKPYLETHSEELLAQIGRNDLLMAAIRTANTSDLGVTAGYDPAGGDGAGAGNEPALNCSNYLDAGVDLPAGGVSDPDSYGNGDGGTPDGGVPMSDPEWGID